MKQSYRLLSFLALVLGLSVTVLDAGSAPEKPQQQAEITGHLFTPAQVRFDESMADSLRPRDGFRVQVFARNMSAPRMMALAQDGTVYVTRPKQDDVVALRDRNGDGRADLQAVVLSGLQSVHGIAIHDKQLYLAVPKTLYVAELDDEGFPSKLRTLLDDLPDGGQHPNRTMAFSSDGLYISVGSTCNACRETNPEHATILRLRRDGRERQVFARGLRNTIGFDWHPVTGELWGMDHGSDWRGDEQPPEELNRLQAGKDYGWPYCYADRQTDRYLVSNPPGNTKEEHCRNTESPALTYQAHAAPIAMVFYRGAQFPSDYQGDAFVAMHGSWNRKEPNGYSVMRIRFRNGRPERFEPFLDGFLAPDGKSYFGRPAGLALARDGALFVSDDANGVIYRVSYGPAVTRR
jgi:glucose/arabinose dehydrogenase